MRFSWIRCDKEFSNCILCIWGIIRRGSTLIQQASDSVGHVESVLPPQHTSLDTHSGHQSHHSGGQGGGVHAPRRLCWYHPSGVEAPRLWMGWCRAPAFPWYVAGEGDCLNTSVSLSACFPVLSWGTGCPRASWSVALLPTISTMGS